MKVPASKSSMQRACAAALLHVGETQLLNPGVSNDDKAALSIIKALGAEIVEEANLGNDKILIKSMGVHPALPILKCGESGLSIRMFTPIAALSSKKLVITGTGSLVSRPMNFFNEIFPTLQVSCESNEGKLPLKIKGPLVPTSINIDGSLSSQFLTGMLMAYSAANASEVTIQVKDLASKPYVDLTLAVMKSFGMKMPVNNNYESFYFDASPVKAQTSKVTYEVEADWSSASFMLVAAAIGGPIEFLGLDLQSTQADKKIMQALQSAGASISIKENSIIVEQAPLAGFEFDAVDCPDLFPPLVALAANCKGLSKIYGVSRLKHKESDRALTLQEEFSKMGLIINQHEDALVIDGGKKLVGAPVHSRHDHRIAMALAIAGAYATGTTEITDANAVGKSYPGFFEDMKLLGSVLSLTV
jgi:3-phosphoshikimate 1-carboxyvinyltransferase